MKAFTYERAESTAQAAAAAIKPGAKIIAGAKWVRECVLQGMPKKCELI